MDFKLHTGKNRDRLTKIMELINICLRNGNRAVMDTIIRKIGIITSLKKIIISLISKITIKIIIKAIIIRVTKNIVKTNMITASMEISRIIPIRIEKKTLAIRIKIDETL